MNMRGVFNTVLLTTGMLVAQAGFGQTSANPAPVKNDTSKTIQMSSPVSIYNLHDAELTRFKMTTYGFETDGIRFHATNPKGQEESFSLMTPTRAEMKKMGASNYNTIIAPLTALQDKASYGIDMYGRSEYASFVVAKDKRAQLTPELLQDGEKLAAFLNAKGNITEIDRGINDLHVRQMFEQNKDNKEAVNLNAGMAFGMAGQ